MDALPSPSIIPNDYGPKVIIVGAIMLSASLMILLVAFYNRFHAKTLSQMDSPFYLLGAVGSCGFQESIKRSPLTRA